MTKVWPAAAPGIKDLIMTRRSESGTRAARALSSVRWGLGCGALLGAIACQKDAAPSVQGEPARAPAATNAAASTAAPSAPRQVELAKFEAPSAAQSPSAEPPAGASAPASAGASAPASAGASAPAAPSPGAAASPAADAPAGRVAPGQVQGAVVTEEPFSAWLQAVSPVAAGSPATVEAVLVAKPPYHCNAEYPHKFKLGAAPTGLSYPETTVKGMQVTAERSVLRIPVVAQSPGPAKVAGTLQFSVCTDERCLVEKRDLSLNLEVK